MMKAKSNFKIKLYNTLILIMSLISTYLLVSYCIGLSLEVEDSSFLNKLDRFIITKEPAYFYCFFIVTILLIKYKSIK